MSAAALMNLVPTDSPRLLAAVSATDAGDPAERETAFDRLEATLGRDFADRLVTALSSEHVDLDR